jgi:transcriptional regulator with XRE-family HTH domain
MNLSIERSRRGWSRAELARRAGLNASTVGLIESGRLNPYPSQLVKIARALNIPDSGTHLLLEETQSSDCESGKQRADQ